MKTDRRKSRVGNEALLWILQNEKDRQDRSGIYGYTQRTLAYNSNRIEGSTLTETQTAALFEEGYLPSSDEVYKRKDIEEMNGHFLMFNKMIATMNEPLSESLIKSFHYELKAGVFEDRANGYAIGEYKQWRNTVGGMTLTAPDEVANQMQNLLEWYHNQIHPFQDGNGRTGRTILYRECLRQNIMPFFIHNENRIEYISSLNKAQTGGDYADLVTLFEKEQLKYTEIYEYFNVEARYKYYLDNTEEDITIGEVGESAPRI